MDQEEQTLNTSVNGIRRPLNFMTPIKKKRNQDTRTAEIQKTPKGKISKSKALQKVSKNKVLIDFDVNKTYFLNANKENLDGFQEESKFNSSLECYEDNQFYYQTPNYNFGKSPFNTTKKSRYESDLITVIKQSKKSEDSPFCKLLNDSDMCNIGNYQLLSSRNDDEIDSDMKQQFESQISTVDSFFYLFAERSSDISNLFDRFNTFEIIGEDRCYPLDTTLNALANAFLRFEFNEGETGFDYKLSNSEEENEIIISTSGKMVSEQNKHDFIMSTKVMLDTSLIKFIKLKIC